MDYLVKIYKTKKSKKHFVTDIVTTDLIHWDDISKIAIGRKYFQDSSKKILNGICNKCEIIRKI
jgi:hypothetical protein